MTWLHLPKSPYSPEPAGGCSAASSTDGSPSATLREKPTVSKSSRPGSETGTSRTRRYGMTSEPLTELPGVDAWISSLRASRANHSPSQGREGRTRTSATGGLIPFASYEALSQGGYSWKTCQASLLDLMGISDEYSETWPRAGLESVGIAYLRQPLAPLTGGIGFGSSGKMLLKTPCASDAYTEGMAKKDQRFGDSGSLAQEVATGFIAKRGWVPTPTAGDAHGSGSRNTENSNAHAGVSLTDYVKGDGGKGRRSPGQLNPMWVEWLMGWPRNWTSAEAMKSSDMEDWLYAQKEHLSPQSAEDESAYVRDLWWDCDPSSPPQGRQPSEQFAGKRPNTLPEVSHSGAHEDRHMGQGAGETSKLRDLWNAVPPRAEQREGETALRKSGVCQGDGPEIGGEALVSRVIENLLHRVDRTRALGNGQVPRVVAAAWRLLR